MIDAAHEKEPYLSHFAQREREVKGTRQPWIEAIRQEAIARFAEGGFPTLREEEWRFTSVAPIAKTLFRPAHRRSLRAEALRPFTFEPWKCHQLVCINGYFSPELSSLGSLPRGVWVRGLGEVLRSDPGRLEAHLARYASFKKNPFTALNTAFIEDGAFVLIPKGAVVEEPIHLLFISTGEEDPWVSHPRSLIVAEASSQVRIVESYVGLKGEVYFTNAVTEIVAGENTVIDYYAVQRESTEAFHIRTLQVSQRRSSNLTAHSLSLGGALVRNDVTVVLDGEGCECVLNGFYMVRGTQHVDNHTMIEHLRPHGTSRELYKGILDEQSSGVFNGKIVVWPGAQKTDAKQTNQNLLLSESALVNTNPQLEIYADDVKCTHGATVGQLDAEALFYLRTRGIDLETSRNLLTYAFASDITRQIKIEPIRAQLERLLLRRWPQPQEIGERL
ncbi:MAG: Fe-S cluster assembly protein SufD [candidate division WOR-3 bacterium]